MATTLNISLEEDQKGWLNARRQAGGYSSASDVVRGLIREAQEREHGALLKEFRGLEADGSNAPEPAADVLRLVRRVKKSRRA
jgi:Arc/MetJ-type ribon-helix-helix transcriptional regulator